MHRFEEIRLAYAVGADHEHEPRLQSQLEPLVGAEVAERSGVDDQALPAPSGF
jgi:hypothetical protein